MVRTRGRLWNLLLTGCQRWRALVAHCGRGRARPQAQGRRRSRRSGGGGYRGRWFGDRRRNGASPIGFRLEQEIDRVSRLLLLLLGLVFGGELGWISTA